MDTNFETPYEEEDVFIECTVCEKSIRGETLYKIHLTTPGHLKKEDAIVASGLAVRQQHVPVFEDIVQYLDYVKLDEPIIGLNYLEELPWTDPQAGPRYACRLCNQNANLSEMVRHVIGRKHRQKYVESKRPDLVTWTKQSIITHGGKIIRAKAEIIERQDGRGCPTKMAKRGIEGRLNITRVPPRQKQNRGQNISQSLTQRDALPSLLELKVFKDEHPRPGRFPPGHPNTNRFHPEDPYILNRDRPMHQGEDALSRDRMEEELRRADFRESDMRRREYLDDNRQQYEEEHVEDPQRRNVLRQGSVPKYSVREEVPCGQAHHAERFPEEPPPYRRPYPERDPLKDFYSEEARRGRVCPPEYQPSQPVLPEGDERRWSPDREPGRFDRQGPSEPEAKRRSFLTPMESDRPCESMFQLTRDYGHGIREHQEEAVADPGPSRTGPSNFQRRLDVARALTDIPEPFRRFLERGAYSEEQGKRKRKSRFSDATAEEVERTKEMFSDECGPPNPKFGGHPRSASEPLRAEIRRPQNPDFYIESQSPRHTESYQRGGSESSGVFDMLKNVDIENAEEADFLKDKLCNLLKEFKTKKSEKAVQNIQGRAAISRDYNSLNPDLELSSRHQYDTTLRQDFDLREPEELNFKEDHRARGWHEDVPDEWHQEYHHPARGEPRQSTRNCYDDVFGRLGVPQMPRAAHPDEPAYYPERFQEPMRPRDYRAAAEEFLDSHSSPPLLNMERGPRMDRGSRYSNNLEKITSTLLELVGRK